MARSTHTPRPSAGFRAGFAAVSASVVAATAGSGIAPAEAARLDPAVPPDADPLDADTLDRVADLTVEGDYGWGKVFTSDTALAESWASTDADDWGLTLNGSAQTTRSFGKVDNPPTTYRNLISWFSLTGLGLNDAEIDGLEAAVEHQVVTSIRSDDEVAMVLPDGRSVTLTFVGEEAGDLVFWGLVAAAPASSTPAPAIPPTLDCDESVAAGTAATCRVTGGDPDIDILWRATSGGELVAVAGVRLGSDGTGTFTVAIPRTVRPGSVDVELVEWDAEDDVAVTPPVPVRVSAGEGSADPEQRAPLIALALTVAGAGVLVRRRGRVSVGALD